MSISINLNIHYSAPANVWEELNKIYKSMPNWVGFHNGFPCWYGNPNDENYLTISVEPSGLQIFGNIDDTEFQDWLELLKDKMTKALGYSIGEPELGFNFKYYD